MSKITLKGSRDIEYLALLENNTGGSNQCFSHAMPASIRFLNTCCILTKWRMSSTAALTAASLLFVQLLRTRLNGIKSI